MCGIVGFNWNDKSLVRRMAAAISHRGPDDQGFFADSSVSLGHRRLSIIDLSSRGRQPMFNEEGDICIVFNGEIFNFQELRPELEEKGHVFMSDTDTEVILHAYEEYGTSCLSRLNGFFAFAIYDMRKKVIFLARDRLGKKPLYYYLKKGLFVFASEMKAILELESVKREINRDALNNFLCLRYSAIPETIIKGIFRLKPGSLAVFDLGSKKLKVERYWRINQHQRHSRDIPEIKKRIMELFEDSVEKRMISDVPVGAYLSGGVDSSAVVAMMSRLTDKVKTFSVGFEGDEIGNELSYASDVSKLFNTEHRELLIRSDCIRELPRIVWHLDEPMSDPAVVPNYILSREAKKKATVILTGDGADELFAGYDQYRFLMMGNSLRWLPGFVRRDIAGAVVKNMPMRILNMIYPYSSSTGKEMFERFRNFFSNIRENRARAYLEIVSIFNDAERKGLVGRDYAPAKPDISGGINSEYFAGGRDFLNSILRLDMETYLPEDLLMKPDKMCMAFGIEARVPFLDYRLVDYSFRIDPALKFNGRATKYIMKKSLEGLLPRRIIYRKKQPFVVPLDIWIERDLKRSIGDMILKGSIIREGIVDRRHIERIFQKYSHSRMYYGRQLWSLINLELWHNIYIEGQDADRFVV